MKTYTVKLSLRQAPEIMSPAELISSWVFDSAVAEFAAKPNSPEPIAAIMRLAMEDGCYAIREKAAAWLKAHCDVVAEITRRQTAPRSP